MNKNTLNDLKDTIYSYMNDDNFPGTAGRKKISNYVYRQFIQVGNKYKKFNQLYSKNDIEQLIDSIADDMQYGEGQH